MKQNNEKRQENLFIDMDLENEVKNRQQENRHHKLLMELEKELKQPFEAVSYKFLFILTVSILFFTYLVYDRNQ